MNKDEEAEKQSESARVREFVLKPGFQMDYRHALYAVYMLKKLPKEAHDQKAAILTEFGQEESFLSIFSLFYPFYRFVRKSEMERRKKWYWNQIREIGYLILLDLLHPEKAMPSEAERKPKQPPRNSANGSDEWVPIRNFSRIRSNHPELFFAASKLQSTPLKGRKRRTDKRFSRYSTIFSEMPHDADELDKEDVWTLQMAKTAAAARSMSPQEIDSRKELTAGLRMVDPEDMLGLERFWELEMRSLEIITSIYGQPSQNAWLLPHLKKRSTVIDCIYQLVDKAIALRWYRTIKSKRKKEQLFREKHPLRYSKEDARRAVEANLRWFEDPIQVVDLIFRGANAYSQIGMFGVALNLYKECLKQVPMEPKDLGLCYHNTGIAYRDMKVPRKYLGYLKRALAVFKELGPFDVGITWAHIAEAYHLLGNQRKFESAKSQSKKILLSSNLNGHQQAEAFLLMADCAAVVRDTAWEKEALALGLDAAVKADNLEFASYYIQRSTDLEQGRNTLIAEKEPGKLKRPPMFPWYKDPSYFTAITPISHKTNNGHGGDHAKP
jgi:tetratricopeptide (TPR) repeat protein